jgi:TetR/AcrR family transcriptional repressor of nem operon
LIETLLVLVEGKNDDEKYKEALRILSSITGAMLIARALDNPQLSEQFLQSVVSAWAPTSGK